MGGFSGRRDVISVIMGMRQVLDSTAPRDYSSVAAEFLCDLFGGTSAAINLMDHTNGRYQTVRNVGKLTVTERTAPRDEYYTFADFPFTTQQLARGVGYRATLDDVDCPQEYLSLLPAQGRGSCLGAPIGRMGQPVGEFWIARESTRPFLEADADLAVACGATLARYFRPAVVLASST